MTAKQDWLSEVLDELWEQSASPKADPALKAQAHKLISAQLIREKIKELEDFSDWINKGMAETHRVKRIKALTNKLKELEDE